MAVGPSPAGQAGGTHVRLKYRPNGDYDNMGYKTVENSRGAIVDGFTYRGDNFC